MKKKVVIIGNSAAGINAIETFRERDRDSDVTLIDAEDCPAYSKVLITYYLADIVTEKGLYIKDWEFYQENGIITVLGQKAVELDTVKSRVVLDDGSKIPYDILLIATGASAAVPEIEWVDTPGVFTLRSIQDAMRIKERANKAGELVILGGGLLSLEVLNALYSPQKKFTLVVSSMQLLSQTSDRESATIIEKVVQEHGVQIIKGKTAEKIAQVNGKNVSVILNSGEEIRADLVFIGKGVKHNIDFLKGTPVNYERGVFVNSRMETNVPGVFAAGDVAQARDRISGGNLIHGIWPEAVEQGRIAGINMAGGVLNHTGVLRLNITHILDQVLAVAGDVESPRVRDTVLFNEPDQRIYRKVSFDEKGRILGAVLVNSFRDIGIIQSLIRTGRKVFFLKDLIATSPVHYGRLIIRSLF